MYYLPPLSCYQPWHQSGMYVIIVHGPVLTHCHPKSVLSIEVHLILSVVYSGFWQVYDVSTIVVSHKMISPLPNKSSGFCFLLFSNVPGHLPPILSPWSLLLVGTFQQLSDEAHSLSIHPPPHPQMSHHHHGRLPSTTSLPSKRSQRSCSHHSGLPHPRMPVRALPSLPPYDILSTEYHISAPTAGALNTGLLKVMLLLLFFFGHTSQLVGL